MLTAIERPEAACCSMKLVLRGDRHRCELSMHDVATTVSGMHGRVVLHRMQYRRLTRHLDVLLSTRHLWSDTMTTIVSPVRRSGQQSCLCTSTSARVYQVAHLVREDDSMRSHAVSEGGRKQPVPGNTRNLVVSYCFSRECLD